MWTHTVSYKGKSTYILQEKIKIIPNLAIIYLRIVIIVVLVIYVSLSTRAELAMNNAATRR